jgi:hypothetical protein
VTRTTPRSAVQRPDIGPPPPFDPECGTFLAALGEILSPSVTMDGIPALRANLAAVTRRALLRPRPSARIERERRPDGGPL